MTDSRSTPPDLGALTAGKQLFVFDWDGTLFDSMEAKTRSFAGVVTETFTRMGHPLPEPEAARLYRHLSGRPRAEIFLLMAKEVGLTLSSADMKAMSDRLFTLNRQHLAEAPLFEDGLALLETVVSRGHGAFISSSVPQAELDHFVGLKLPAHLLTALGGTFGSSPGFGKGPQHIGEIRSRRPTPISAILVVGDDVADDTLALATGVDCIVVDRDDRLGGQVRCRVPSLREVLVP